MAVTGEGSLNFETLLDNSGLLQGSNEAVDIITKMASRIAAVNPFAALATIAALAFGAMSYEAYKFAKDFDNAMSQVKLISEDVAKNITKVKDEIFKISLTSNLRPDEIAKEFQAIIEAGYDSASGLKILDASTKIANTGLTELGKNVINLTTILNAYGIEAEKAAGINDILFRAAETGGGSFESIEKSLAKIAPLAAKYDVSLTEIAAAYTSLRKGGLDAGQAVQTLSSLLTDASNKLGEGYGSVMSFQESIQALYNRAEGSKAKMNELGISIKSVGGIALLAGENFEEAIGQLENFSNVSGKVAEASTEALKTNGNQWDVLKNKISDATKGLGEYWLGVVNSVSKGINQLIDDGDELADSVGDQAGAYRVLIRELNSSNTAEDRKREILQELKTLHPGYLEGLDKEQIQHGNLDTIMTEVQGTLEKINELYRERIKLASGIGKINAAEKALAEAEAERESNLEKFTSNIAELEAFAAKNEITLKYNIDDDFKKQVEDIRRSIYDSPQADNIGKDQVSFVFKMLGGMQSAAEAADEMDKSVESATNRLQTYETYTENIKRKTYDNIDNYKEIEAQINRINDVSKLAKFDDYVTPQIREAVKARKELLNSTKAINDISVEYYEENKNAFADYIASDNQAISDLARKRKANIEAFLKSSAGIKAKESIADYKEELAEAKKNYDTLQAYRERGLYEMSDTFKKAKGLEYDTYTEYTNAIIESTAAMWQKQMAILTQDPPPPKSIRWDQMLDSDFLETEFERILDDLIPKFHQDFNQKMSSVSMKPPSFGEVNKTDNPWGIQMDFDSWENAAEQLFGKMKKLQADFGDQGYSIIRTQREAYKAYIAASDKALRDMTTNELKARKEVVKELLAAAREKKKLGGDDKDEAKKSVKFFKTEMFNINSAMLESAQMMIANMISALTEAANLFRKFGNEDVAEVLDQFAGVGEGISRILQGDIVGGTLAAINSMITVETNLDTEALQKELDKLSREVDKLANSLVYSIGTEKIKDRLSLMEKQNELQEELNRQIKLEEEARKEIKLFGLTVGSKGRGSGTDQKRLEELQDGIEETKQDLFDLQNQIDELLTGSTADSITDAIIKGFEDGKTSAQDFGETFEEIMKKAMVNALQVQFLEQSIKPFFEKFAKFADDNGDGVFDLTSSEITRLSREYKTIVQNSTDQIAAFNAILDEAGIAGGIFGETAKDANSLAGAIKNITTEQADLLAGITNAMRIDLREILEYSSQSLDELRRIAANTAFNHHLESMDDKLTNIETALA